jgi:hypothetical protein
VNSVLPLVVIVVGIAGANGLIWQSLFLSVAWFMVVIALWLILATSEFFLRRVLEQPGGVVGGIAAVLAVAAGLLKAF